MDAMNNKKLPKIVMKLNIKRGKKVGLRSYGEKAQIEFCECHRIAAPTEIILDTRFISFFLAKNILILFAREGKDRINRNFRGEILINIYLLGGYLR